MAERCECFVKSEGVKTEVEGERIVTRFTCLACGGETQPTRIQSAADWHI